MRSKEERRYVVSGLFYRFNGHSYRYRPCGTDGKRKDRQADTARIREEFSKRDVLSTVNRLTKINTHSGRKALTLTRSIEYMLVGLTW